MKLLIMKFQVTARITTIKCTRKMNQGRPLKRVCMCENGTGQQLTQLPDYMMMTMLVNNNFFISKYSSRMFRPMSVMLRYNLDLWCHIYWYHQCTPLLLNL
jgi:hypothetical protein